MERFNDCSLYIQNFKCFGPKPQGFEYVRRLNLIIGRNNTGKSALLDLVRFAVEPFDLAPYAHKSEGRASVLLYGSLTDAMVDRFFPSAISSPDVPGPNHREYGKTLVGGKLQIELLDTGKRNPRLLLDRKYVSTTKQYLERVCAEFKNPFAGLRFAQIAAERDIAAEADADGLTLDANGTGATNIIQRIINDENYPSELVERSLLEDLNKVMGPDAHFTRIATQKTGGNKWVVYLDEDGKGRISLANSGSGLKTIILVLLNILVLPQIERWQPSEYVFAFEELENNLHPGLQRRLFKYVQDKLAKTGAIGFVTTHAPAVIDIFSTAKDAQILRVVHDGQSGKVLTVTSSSDGHGVLDDLDVRASDLLQANGIIWVEGISDVIYLRRWIELYCEQEGREIPVEGSEYAFMEYGGRCLKHFDFSAGRMEDLAAEDARWLLPALAVSRNTYLVIDSDKRDAGSVVNETKLKAAEGAKGGHWITMGREIENYVPPKVAKVVFGKELTTYQSAAAVYKTQKNSKLDKKKIATDAVEQITLENWCHQDVEEQVGRLVDAIASWNSV